MKLNFKHTIIFTCLIILTIGCTAQNNELNIENPTAYNHGTDYQHYLHEIGSGLNITESEDGYYFINGSYLYYMDKQSMEPILLDHNPNNDCSPSNVESVPRNCNAYVYNEHIHFQGIVTYYNEQLYAVMLQERTDKDVIGSKKYVLVQMNKDGSDRKVIREFDDRPSPVLIHRNHIYFVDNTKDPTNARNPKLLSVPLTDPKQEPTELYTIELTNMHFNDAIAYGNHLYFRESGRNMYRTIKYNLSTNEYEPLYSGYEGNAAISSILDNTLFFSLFTGDESDEKSWDQYRSNLEGQDVTLLPMKRPVVSHLLADDRYYYLNPVSWYIKGEQFSHVKDEMIIYDLNYEEIELVDTSMLEMWTFAYTGNDQHMFVRSYGTNDYQQLYYLDKSTIGSGNAKLELLVESAAPLR